MSERLSDKVIQKDTNGWHYWEGGARHPLLECVACRWPILETPKVYQGRVAIFYHPGCFPERFGTDMQQSYDTYRRSTWPKK